MSKDCCEAKVAAKKAGIIDRVRETQMTAYEALDILTAIKTKISGANPKELKEAEAAACEESLSGDLKRLQNTVRDIRAAAVQIFEEF